MSDERTARDGLQEVEMLLPFHASGHLPPHEAAQVEQYLSDHPDRLQSVAEEKEAVAACNEAIAPAQARNFAKVAARISPSVRSVDRGFSVLGTIRRFFEMPSARSVRWAGAVAVILIVAQAVTIVRLAVTQYSNQFVTASGGPIWKGPGRLASVRFADAATYPAIAAMLADLHITIVDGPLGGGLFTIRIGPPDMRDAERDRIIEALNARRDIVAFVVRLR
jgi:hypothetical protein